MEDVQGIYIRQTGIVDVKKLNHKIAVIGAGSIGGWTALCLGKLGCRNITVFDFDNVEIHNAGSQVFKAGDDGQPKVEALKFRLSMLLEEPIEVVNTKWTPQHSLKDFDIVIAAVDSIAVREEIFKHLHEVNFRSLYIDARMASNIIEIYTTHMDDLEELEHYGKTLFAEGDAREIPCSERSVVYNVFVVAGMIGDLVGKHANEQELPKALEIDLFNFDLFKT